MNTNLSQFHIVEISGSNYERGFIHGKSLKPIIQKIIGAWAENIKSQTGLPLDLYANRIKHETLLFKAIQTHTPDLLEEVHGIADGAELPRIIVEAWQYLDEHEWFIKDFILCKKNSAGNACSTFGFKNQNNIILGQNLDIPSYKDGIQTILKIKDSTGLSSIIFTQAGALASFGVNHSPVGICVNSLAQLAYRIDGLPVTYMIRRILQNNNLDAAITTLKNLPHATGHNYLLGDSKRFDNFECSANSKISTQQGNSNFAYHTNHTLVNNEQRSTLTKEEQLAQEQRIKDFSLPRYKCLENSLITFKDMSVSQAKQLLATTPVSISLKRNLKQFTFISAIFEFGSSFQVWAAPGAPEEYDYIPISWPG